MNVPLHPSEQRYSRISRADVLHQCDWPNLENRLPLSRVAVRELGSPAHLATTVAYPQSLVEHPQSDGSCQADCLIRMYVSWSDCSHKSNPSFHTISKVPWIVQVSAVVVVRIHRCVNDTHHNNSILKASEEDLGSKVMEQVEPGSSWHPALHPCSSPSI